MCILALAQLPYGYYTLLRFVVCGVAGWSAYVAFGMEKLGWGWVLGGIALVFNPLIPIHLAREIWAPIDVAVAVMLLISIAVVRPEEAQES